MTPFLALTFFFLSFFFLRVDAFYFIYSWVPLPPYVVVSPLSPTNPV